MIDERKAALRNYTLSDELSTDIYAVFKRVEFNKVDEDYRKIFLNILKGNAE